MKKPENTSESYSATTVAKAETLIHLFADHSSHFPDDKKAELEAEIAALNFGDPATFAVNSITPGRLPFIFLSQRKRLLTLCR